MDFRRSGQLDERRRRVLMDEIATPSDTDKAQATTSSKGPVRAYSESVLSDRQKRVSEFIPLRPFAVIATILLLLTAVAGIEALYIFATPPGGYAKINPAQIKAGATTAEHPFAALDLDARGNIGSWFSSLMFAGGVLMVYSLLSIRAHRVDDYRGRYRVWWWVGVALAWASIDTATGLHDALGHALQLLAGDGMPGGHKLLWVGIYGLIFGTLGLRASFEIWSSLAAMVAASCAALLYFAGIALHLEMAPLPGGHVLQTVISSSLTLLAHVSLITAVLLYARHVHFDAQGRLMVTVDASPKAKKKPKSKAKLAVVADDDAEKKPAAKDKKEADKKEVDKKEAPTAAKPAAASGLKFGSSTAPTASASISSKTNTAPSNYADDDDEDEDEDEDSNLSKSERRRLKKLARRDPGQQRRAA
ncbi:hypothetical protein ETAA8_62120 [Anatilimnocola aggregata]|uniref:Uncharacterized protein n=1 Tax=Anatilimnocola aggregata TaxID=2528021 RepID=A0A517YLG1_9BACT|nr:hypothetical protein [Anatilimnocola aggregata]QDU31059.1 hypothetical protein ETAA8_62120 [Anatilimnocola aggregata]